MLAVKELEQPSAELAIFPFALALPAAHAMRKTLEIIKLEGMAEGTYRACIGLPAQVCPAA